MLGRGARAPAAHDELDGAVLPRHYRRQTTMMTTLCCSRKVALRCTGVCTRFNPSNSLERPTTTTRCQPAAFGASFIRSAHPEVRTDGAGGGVGTTPALRPRASVLDARCFVCCCAVSAVWCHVWLAVRWCGAARHGTTCTLVVLVLPAAAAVPRLLIVVCMAALARATVATRPCSA